ncbi:MAG TPA: GNAT family N-acetyltransferase [Candidatus Dormibacteraeota bacterium]|nr:GNAT family N-acetyltransferase [Candidatus Dormibacteraeota bacterium]
MSLTMINMLVDLDERLWSRARPGLYRETLDRGVVLHERQGVTPSQRAWLRGTFGGLWSDEVSTGYAWFATDWEGRELGFAAYDCKLDFPWLRRWRAQPDVGIFGPMGVAESERKHGLGSLLCLLALQSLQRQGYARALIGAVGPEAFYERVCGARRVEEFPRAQVVGAGLQHVLQSVATGKWRNR